MKNKNFFFYFILAIAFTFIYFQTFDSKLNLNGDNAHYIKLAENISQGLGYTHTTPDKNIAVNHFPPGYSAFLSIFMWLGIKNLIFFKILNGLLLWGSIAGLFYTVKRITGNKALAFSGSFLTFFSPKLLEFSSMVMSEMFFLACSVACFVFLLLYSRRKEKKFLTSPYFYLSIITAVLTYYTRMVGLAVIFALIIFFLFRKEWLQAISALVGCILLILPWSLRNAYHGIESRYFGVIMTVNPWQPEKGTISSVSEMIEKMLANFDETVIKGFKEVLFPFVSINYDNVSGLFPIIVGLLILAVIFYGAWNMKSLRWAFIAYLVAQTGLFMLWHGGNGSRYVVPIVPFLFICFYTGLYNLIRLKWNNESKVLQHLPYAFLMVALFMYPSVKTQGERAKQPYPPAYRNYFAIAKKMHKQLPENSVCCCRKPALFSHYASKIYTVNYKYTLDTDELLEDLIRKKVDYVVLEQLGYSSTPRYLYPAIVANPDLFPVLWHYPNPDTYLLKFEREKAQSKIENNRSSDTNQEP